MQERTSQQAPIHEIKALPGDLMNLHEIVAKARQISTRTIGTTSSGAPNPRRP